MTDTANNYFENLFEVNPSAVERLYEGLRSRGVDVDKIPTVLSYILEESGGDPKRIDRFGSGLLDGIEYDDNMFLDDDDSLIESQLDSIAFGINTGSIPVMTGESDTAYGGYLRNMFAEGGGVDKRFQVEPAYPQSYSVESLESLFRESPYRHPNTVMTDEGEMIEGVEDITSKVINGTDSRLYDRDWLDSRTVFKDGRGKYVIVDNETLPSLNSEKLGDRVSYDELVKQMPGIRYIGGDGYRLRTAQLIPGLIDMISEKSKNYGVSRNMVLNRLMHEGFIDRIVNEYNDLDRNSQRTYFTDGNLYSRDYNGYSWLGLDDAGQNLIDGAYELHDRNARWHTYDDLAQNEHGRELTNVPVAEGLDSAVEMMAAELAYRQNELRRRGISEEDIEAYTNAAFNSGLNHRLLGDRDWVIRNYSVPDWYGQINRYDGETMPSGYMNRGQFGDDGKYAVGLNHAGFEPMAVNVAEPGVVIRNPFIENQYAVPLMTDTVRQIVENAGQKPQQPAAPEFKFARKPKGTIQISEEDIYRMPQVEETMPIIDNLQVSLPQMNESIKQTSIPEALYFQNKALGKDENRAVTEALRQLPSSGDDLKDIQAFLLENNYYDTSRYVPKITAKTKEEVMELQRMLKGAGYDLGEYGVNRDGIDGNLGGANSKTRKAWEQYVKDNPSEAMKAHFVDGILGNATRAAYARYLTDGLSATPPQTRTEEQTIEGKSYTSLPKIENSPLSLQMYEAISTPTRLAGMATTVIPSHIGAFMNKQANNVYGKLVGIEDYDAYIGDTVENAYLNLERAKQSGNAERIENAQAELAEARNLLRTNKLNRRTMSRAEKEAYMSVLTHINGERQMTYDDYLKNIELIGGNDGDFLGTNSKHKHKKIKGKDVMLYGGNSSYSLSNMFEDENELVNTGKKATTTAGAIVSAEKRIYHDPNRGRTGSSSYYIDKEGNIHISDRLEATEEKAKRGKNDSEAYNMARDYFPRGSTGRIEDIITAQEYKRFIERVNRRKAIQNK